MPDERKPQSSKEIEEYLRSLGDVPDAVDDGGSLGPERKFRMDEFKVARWFERDPSGCRGNRRARGLLRGIRGLPRPWVPDAEQMKAETDPKRHKAMFEAVRQGWWDGARERIQGLPLPGRAGGKLSERASERIADFLMGYVLNREYPSTVPPESRRFLERMLKAAKKGSGVRDIQTKSKRVTKIGLRTKVVALIFQECSRRKTPLMNAAEHVAEIFDVIAGEQIEPEYVMKLACRYKL